MEDDRAEARRGISTGFARAAAPMLLLCACGLAGFLLWRGAARSDVGSSPGTPAPSLDSAGGLLPGLDAAKRGGELPGERGAPAASGNLPSMHGIPESLCPGMRRWLALLRHEDKYVRRQAMEVLASVVGPQDADVVPLILEAMRSDDMVLRRYCAKALGRIGKGGDEAVRLAVEALEVFGKSLEGDDIVEGLGGFGLGSVEAVLAIVRCGSAADTRIEIEALERICPGADAAIPGLIERLRDRGGHHFRAFRALARIGAGAVPALQLSLDSGDSGFRSVILALLQDYGPAAGEAVPAIRKILAEEPDRQWRSRFPFSDRLFKEDPDFELRCEFWASHDRGAALSALGEIGPGAVSALPEILGAWRGTRDPDAWAAMIKVNPRSSRVVETLVAMLKKGELDGIPAPESPKGGAEDPADEVLRIVRERAVAEIAEGRARAFALRTLGLLGPRAGDAVPAIVAAMEADSKIENSALETLAWIGPDSAGAVQGIVAKLPRSRREIQEGCGYENILGTLRAIGPRAVETCPALPGILESILLCESGEIDYMDRNVWKALADVAPSSEAARKGAVIFIAQANPEELGEREYVEKARRMLDGPEAVPALMATPWIKPSREWRGSGELAADFLARIGPSAIPALVQALGSQDWMTRSKAARALSRMHPRSSEAEAVLKPLLKDAEPWVRIEAARALGWISEDPSEAVAVLAKEFGSRDESRRWESSQALAEIGPAASTAIPGLLTTLNIEKSPGEGVWSGQEGAVRIDAVYTLSKIGWGSDEVIRALVCALRSDVGHLAGPEPAAMALGNIGTRAIPELLRALKEDNENTRSQCCVVLGRLGKDSVEAIPVIAKALSDPETGVRLDAAQALGRIGPESLPCLVEGLRKGDKYAGWACAAALGRLGRAAEPALPALVEVATDESGKASISVLDALVQIWPDPARQLASILPRLKGQTLREEAATKLAKMDPAAASSFVDVLIAKLDALTEGELTWDRRSKLRALIGTFESMGPCARAAVPALIAIVMRDMDPETGFAVRALHRIAPGDPRVLSAFETAFLRKNRIAMDEIRRLAERAAMGE